MKNHYRRLISSVFSLVVSGFILASNVTPAQAAVNVKVDDDHVQCPTAAFTDIQSAINSVGANPGTITVCAGTYYGPLNVLNANKLKLVAKKGVVVRPASVPFNGVLLNVISSQKVTVQGFTFDGLGNVGPSLGNSALQFSESSGKIMKNTIQNWHTLNYATSANQIYSIYLTSGNVQPIQVAKNTIVEYQGRGMQIEGRSVIKVTSNKLIAGTNANNTAIAIYTLPIGAGFPTGSISSNKITGYYHPAGAITSGIVLFETGNMKISGNTLTNQIFGIYVFAGGSYLSHADNNKITGNKLSEVLQGIKIESSGAYSDTYADNNRVTGNKIKNTAFTGSGGIVVSGDSTSYHGYAQNEVVKGNSISGFNYRVFVYQGTNGTVTGVVTVP